MANEVLYNFEKDSSEVKTLLGIEEKGVFDKLNVLEVSLYSDTPLAKQGNNAWEFLDNPEIEVTGQKTLKVKVVGQVEADIDLSEFGVDFEGNTSIIFSTHLGLTVQGSIVGVSNDLSTPSEKTTFICKATDYGFDELEYRWADEEAEEAVSEQIEDYLKLSQYIYNKIIPKIEGSKWFIEIKRSWRFLSVPQFSNKSNAELAYKEIANILPLRKYTTVMKSRKNGNFSITVESFSTSENKEIKGEPVAYLITPFITRDAGELVGKELKDSQGNSGYIKGGTIEYRRQDAVSLVNMSGNSATCPSEVVTQAVFDLELAYGNMDSGIKTRAKFMHEVKTSGEAVVELVD